MTGVTEKLFMCQMFMCLFRPLCLRVCWPAREARTGKSPKVLPECPRECSQKSGLGVLPRAPRFLRALSRALGEHFRRFPCSRLPSRPTDTQPSCIDSTTISLPSSKHAYTDICKTQIRRPRFGSVTVWSSSWKPVPAVPVLLSVSGKTVPVRFRFPVPVRFLRISARQIWAPEKCTSNKVTKTLLPGRIP